MLDYINRDIKILFMINPKEFRFECIKCGNCCVDKNTLVNVTYHDIHRISDGLKLTLDECLELLGFYIFDKPPSEEELKKMVIPPIETEKGLAFVGLKKDVSGNCYFFNDQEKICKIYKLRPNFCRTFPFSFRILINKDDNTKAKIELYYTDKGIEYCPGIGEEAPLINEDEWIIIGKKTVTKLNDNNILTEKWNEAVKSGKIDPTARAFLQSVFSLKEKK